MNIFEAQNEDAVEILADLIEPAAKILANEEVQTLYKAKAPKLKIISTALKADKKAVLEIAAIAEGVDPKEYKCTIPSLIKSLLNILNTPGVDDLFQSQGRIEEKPSSGSAMENTEANEQ